jgi:serine/threonine-protein kinase HipA
MKKLNVIYRGWGERYELGILAEDGGDVLFEYSTQAIKRGLELSLFKLPLSTKSYGDFPEHQLRLPGMICDALPDGWGMLLMDRLFRKEGRDLSNISPLDRLAFIGDRTMGALTFEPAYGVDLAAEDLRLLELAEDIQHAVNDESEVLLRKLALIGGSPHGARPKALINFDRNNNRMSNSESSVGTPMLVKFPAQNEHKEVCAIEAMYGRIASVCEIRVPVTEYFDLNGELSAFGIERFDRSDGLRIPMHTAAGAAHVDFRVPQLDYVALLRLTHFMTRDAREVLQAFARCVFNIVFNNLDDHSKNFSFLMGRDGRWKFSPAYDLTFSQGPNGEHQMDICGEARVPGRKHLLQLASKTDVTERSAMEIIERIATVAEHLTDFVGDLPIKKETLALIEKAVKANRARII